MNPPEYTRPIWRVFTDLAKKSIGILSSRIEPIGGIDRFFYVLVLIAESDGKLTQQKLSNHLNTDKVFTVRIIDYLSEKGMVKRSVNKEDRREHLLELTPKGVKLVPIIKKVFKELEEEMFNGISPKARVEFSRCLLQVQKNICTLPDKEVNLKLKFNPVNKSKK